MVSMKVFLVGVTGETGGSILNGLLKAGFDNIHALIRPASLEKPVVSSLKEQGVQIHSGDITDPLDKLVPLLKDVDTVICCIVPNQELAQIHFADAAKAAGVKRFVPTNFGIVAPVGGVMLARDRKEEVLNHIRQIWLPYTVIEVGFWYQVSVPVIPSGKLDRAVVPWTCQPIIYGDGNTKTALMDVRDVGTWVAKIIQDERTLNKSVFAYSEVLSQNELFDIVEQASGEKLNRQVVPKEKLKEQYDAAVAKYKADPSDPAAWIGLYGPQYSWSKFIRGDNTPEYAEYLGYVDATKLYTDLSTISVEDFLKEAFAGKAPLPYGGKMHK